jgi:hypothetical protein
VAAQEDGGRSVKLPINVEVSVEDIAQHFKYLPRNEAHRVMESLLAALDTDTYLYAGRWIDDNPIDASNTAECQRCKRTTYRRSSDYNPKVKVCEYCGAVLP